MKIRELTHSELMPETFMELFHVTTPKKAKMYRETGCIRKPVRGFTTLKAAMCWAMKTQRQVIYRIDAYKENSHKLPDHHNEFGEAWWIDQDIAVKDITCVVSPK